MKYKLEGVYKRNGHSIGFLWGDDDFSTQKTPLLFDTDEAIKRRDEWAALKVYSHINFQLVGVKETRPGMRKVYKYVIQPNSSFNGTFKMDVPTKVGAIPLCVMMKDNVVCLYLEVDTDEQDTIKSFYSIGTGHGSLDDTQLLTYLGSVLQDIYVWHIYY